MPFINIAQPNGLSAKHITVTITDSHVLLTTNNDMWLMDRYDAFELGRMLQDASKKLMLERTVD